MAITIAETAQGGIQIDRFLSLIQMVPLRPIKSEEGLDRAIGVIDSLIVRDDRDVDEQDYLDVLVRLVEAYEAEHHPIRSVSDAETLSHLIDAQDVAQSMVAAETGIAESTISEILAGKRGLNRRHIGVFARYFHVGPAVFRFD